LPALLGTYKEAVVVLRPDRIPPLMGAAKEAGVNTAANICF
jgi:hypothetical protein